jgi:hypothetical protein
VGSVVESGSGVVSEEEPKKELAQLVKALREAVVELREALGELGNPLNQVAAVSKPEEVISTSSNAVSEGSEKDLKIDKLRVGEGKPVTPYAGDKKTLRKPGVEGKYVNLKTFMKFMRLANLLLDRVDKDMLIHYITFMNKLNLIRDDELELMKVIIDLVDEGRKRSLSVDEQIAMFSIIADNFGFRDELVDSELMAYVLKLIVSK